MAAMLSKGVTGVLRGFSSHELFELSILFQLPIQILQLLHEIQLFLLCFVLQCDDSGLRFVPTTSHSSLWVQNECCKVDGGIGDRRSGKAYRDS